jgi:hypothetical protein
VLVFLVLVCKKKSVTRFSYNIRRNMSLQSRGLTQTTR